MKKILLVGNPNVGKSVIFSRMTGVRTTVSNYPGTTISYTQGYMKLGDEKAELIDVPGIYSLRPTCEAEETALNMLKQGDVVVNVVNATNLERSLYLTLQLLETGIPVVIALNMWDDTKHRGIHIDLEKLQSFMGVPLIPTVALTGEGIRRLALNIPRAVPKKLPEKTREERWAAVGEIVAQVQYIENRHHTLLERLQDASGKPVSGGLIAAFVLVGAFFVIRFIAENLIAYVLEPFFEGFWKPVVLKISDFMGGGGFLHDILVGQLIGGDINFVESFGLITSGLYVPFAMVLPYIFSFYLILGLLEDTGYLPRLAVLMDTLMHWVGLHGYAIIPTLLGLGCNVPAILGTRILESKRERFIAATLISIAVPCAALQAMVFGLVGAHGGYYVLMVYGTLFVVWIVLGKVLHYAVRGFTPELLIEIPPYRFPPIGIIISKMWMRIRGFLAEAIPIIMGAVVVINILYHFGILQKFADFTQPVITGVLGLPKEVVMSLILGFLRKDVALGMLAPLALSPEQLVIASVVMAMSFPCIATFIVFLKELGFWRMCIAGAVMISAALITGGILNFIL